MKKKPSLLVIIFFVCSCIAVTYWMKTGVQSTGADEFQYGPIAQLQGKITKKDLSARTQEDTEPSTTFSDSSFVVFDGTSFDAQSETLTQAGLAPVHIIYHSHLWGPSHKQLRKTDPWGLPPQDRLIKQARRAKAVNSELAILDIEHWPIEDSREEVLRSMHNYITVYDMFKQAQPDVKVGYYDVVPRKNWYAEKPRHVLDRWRSNNDLLGPLAEKVDAFFPNLYAYKKDQEYWVASAKLLLKEARRIGGDKPVYAFLWPQYWAAQDKSLRDRYIDADFWRLQLQTARKYADGVVIWFPYDTKWEEASKGPWWKVTKEFIEKSQRG